MPDIYLGNQNLKAAGVTVEYSQEEVQAHIKCATNHLYFIKKYVKIVSIDEGLVPFDTWDFQDNMVKTFEQNRFSICKLPRQVGKTTTVGAYILWKALFTEDYNIAILANKRSQAIEILGRIQLMYEHLPKWLQQGVVEWNKASIKLENGTEILASSTSSSAIRGTSQNLIYLDEFAFVPNNIQEEFFTSVFPTISSGKTSKVIVTSTPNGMNLFYKLWVDSEENRNDYERLDVHWSDVPGRDAAWREATIRNTSEEQFRVEFECEFIGSSNTLISPSKLRMMTFHNPIWQNEHMRVYEQPQENHIYATIVDTARGVGGDYSAFTVIDCSDVPYKVVAAYQNNNIPPMVFPNVVADIATKFNKSYILVESNDIGMSVAETLHNDLEIENVLMSSARGRAGQVLSSGFGGVGQQYLGVRTTKQVKRVGCLNLKTLIEGDKLYTNDFHILEELTRFVARGESWEAEEGSHDDLVMTLVLFGWLANQDYFKELTSVDIRKNVEQQHLRLIEEDMTPFGLIADGHDAHEEQFQDAVYDWESGERVF